MKKLVFLPILLVCAFVARATYNTVTLAGFNRDIISNGAASAASTISPSFTAGADSAGYAMVAQDYSFGSYTPTYSLPVTGALTSGLTATLTYQLADYSANNALRLVSTGDNGVLTFASPQPAGSLYVLGTSLNSDSYADVTVTFTDATTQVFPGVFFPDWYSAGGAITGIGRVSTVDNHTEGTSSQPSLFESQLNIAPANLGKIVASITFQKSSGTGYTTIMAVSASDVCSGSPAAGIAAATVLTGCGTYSSVLSLTGGSTSGGLLYQWQSSPDGSTWTSISGATNATYTANITTSTFYQAVVTCAASGLSSTSTPIELFQTAPAPTVATLPYAESFESWSAGCATADRPGTSWTTNPTTGNNSWRRNDEGSDAGWSLVSSYMYSPASTTDANSARFHSGYTYYGITGSMDLHIDLSTAGTKQLSFDYINLSGSDYLTVQLSEDGGITYTDLATLNTTSAWEHETVTTTSVAANALIRFKATADYGSTDIGIDNLLINVLTACSGTPVAGTFTASQTTGCSEFMPALALASSSISGLTYQWQSAPDSATWTDVAGATATTYNADITGSIYYRAVVTCTASGLSDVTPGVHFQVVTAVATSATLPYFEGFESWIGTCYAADRPGNNWLETPTTGNGAWRRDDQGADAAWHNPADYMYTPASVDGAHSARFHSGWASGGTEGDLDLHVDLSATGAKMIQFNYNNADGSDHMDVQLSEDGGSTFTTLGTFTTTATGWTPEIVTTSSTAANAIIRFRGISDYGGSDIGIDSLYVSVEPGCAGTPVAGTFTSDITSGCTAYTSNLSVDAPIFLTGITYQWQSSADGASYTDVAGATNTTYAASVTANTWYRFYVVCTASGLADTSAATELTYSPVTPVTATVPFFESFESWMAGCYSFDRPGTNWVLSPTSGNNSWRRNDQGSDASWTSAGSGGYSPTSTDASYSARFHSYYASSGSVGNMDLYINLSAAGTKNIQFDYVNTDGDDVLNVQISEDGGATFTTLATLSTATAWTPETVTTSSTASNAIIRLSATSDYGNSDIGIDSFSVSVAPGCTGTPTAGSFSSSVSSGCAAYSSTLSVDAPVYMSGISYQWQQSATGTGYSDIPGATSTTYIASVTGNVFYRFYVICSTSGLADTSAASALTMTPEVAVAATLPYFQGFENWTGSCNPYDRPDTSWILDPNTGNNSWRRDDQGSDASWTSISGGSYAPVSEEGSHSARFHSYYASSGSVGNMDLTVNLSTAGMKNISFYYTNAEGSDALTVSLSEDGGATFSTLGTYATTMGWEHETLTTASVAPNAILRFSATSDFGNTDIGLDSLYINGPAVVAPCDTVTGLTTSAITTNSAVLSWTPVAGVSGYEFVIDNTSVAPSGSGTPIADTAFTATSLTCNTVYYLHVRTDCSVDSSAWETISFTTDTCVTTSTGNVNATAFAMVAYPNPAKETVTLSVKGRKGEGFLKLTDVSGKTITTMTVTDNNTVIDISQLAAGIYFINYRDDATNQALEISKQ